MADIGAPLIVVSVLHWNTPALTRRCLAALRQSRDIRLRVVLVDNASQDGSAAALQAEFTEVTWLPAPANLGFAGGHALALQPAQAWNAAAICLLNSDAEVEPGTLAGLAAAWREGGDALYGALPLRRAGQDIQINFPEKFLAADARPRAWRRDRPLRFDADWQQRPVQTVGALAGSCVLLPMTVIDAHGWLDTDWFLYCEEIDYCLRLRHAGVASRLVPAARVWHGGGGSHAGQPGVADCVAYYQARNEIVLAHRHAAAGVAQVIALKKWLRALLLGLGGSQGRARLLRRAVRDARAGRMGKTLAPETAWRPDAC